MWLSISSIFLPLMLMSVLVNYRITHDFSLSQVHIETYWFAGFMDVLYHLFQFRGWFNNQNYIIWKDGVGQVFTIELVTSVFPADLANDVQSLGEMLSPCLTPLCSLNFLLSVCRWITDVASWYRCFMILR